MESFSLIPTPEEYIQRLRERHIVKPKMSAVLDRIVLYVRDLKVYRVLLVADYHCSARQLRKAGLKDEYTQIEIEPAERIRIDSADINIDKGTYLLHYDIKSHNIGIYNGEVE